MKARKEVKSIGSNSRRQTGVEQQVRGRRQQFAVLGLYEGIKETERIVRFAEVFLIHCWEGRAQMRE